MKVIMLPGNMVGNVTALKGPRLFKIVEYCTGGRREQAGAGRSLLVKSPSCAARHCAASRCWTLWDTAGFTKAAQQHSRIADTALTGG